MLGTTAIMPCVPNLTLVKQSQNCFCSTLHQLKNLLRKQCCSSSLSRKQARYAFAFGTFSASDRDLNNLPSMRGRAANTKMKQLHSYNFRLGYLPAWRKFTLAYSLFTTKLVSFIVSNSHFHIPCSDYWRMAS